MDDDAHAVSAIVCIHPDVHRQGQLVLRVDCVFALERAEVMCIIVKAEIGGEARGAMRRASVWAAEVRERERGYPVRYKSDEAAAADYVTRGAERHGEGEESEQ